MFKCSQRFKQCAGQTKHTKILAQCGLDSFPSWSPPRCTPWLGRQFSTSAFHRVFCLVVKPVVYGCEAGGITALKGKRHIGRIRYAEHIGGVGLLEASTCHRCEDPLESGPVRKP